MKIASYGKTDVGKVRELNEDNYLISEEHGLLLVADGMGGHAAGEVASALAVQVISSYLDENSDEQGEKLPQEFMTEAIERANQMIHAEAADTEEKKGMGTTIVAALIQDNHAYVAHVGDSRAYLLRQGQLEGLTSDHSWVNFQVQIGNITEEQAKYHPLKNIITKALGIQDSVDVEMSKIRLLNGDRLLLCSDGLTGMVPDDDILRVLTEHEDDLDKAVQELIELALENGGEDNVTAVLCHYTAEDEEDMEDTQPIQYVPPTNEFDSDKTEDEDDDGDDMEKTDLDMEVPETLRDPVPSDRFNPPNDE